MPDINDPTPPTFTAEDAMRTIKTLRDALGLGQFPLQTFVGMSDKVEQQR